MSETRGVPFPLAQDYPEDFPIDQGGGRGPDPASPTFGIRLLYLRNRSVDAWLTKYDPDGGDENVDYPTGQIESSDDPSKALRFVDRMAALEVLRQQSKRTPFRPDGKPNRPLSAFTVEIIEIPKEGE